MLADITTKFDDNLARVRNLVALYIDDLAGVGQGRRPVHSSDVLRAATVLLHATLEEYLRGLSRWKLPLASEDALNGIPIVGSQRPDKSLLGRLASHRGKSVDDVIAESVDKYLERSNYNSTTEVSQLLERIGVDTSAVSHLFPTMAEIMDRRHQIVHRADREDRPGRGFHRARSIGRRALGRWIEAVLEFAAKVSNQLAQ